MLGVIATLLAVAASLFDASPARAAMVTVRCDRGADLQAAIDRARSGDRLIIHGTCRGTHTIIGKDLTLEGRGPLATLDAGGRGAALRVDWDGRRWHRRDSRVRLVALHVTGSGGRRHDHDGIHSWGRLTLVDSLVRLNRGDGIGGDAGIVKLVRSKVRANDGHGIRGGDSYDAVMRDSAVSRNRGGGVVAAEVRALRSRIRGNGGHGIHATPQGTIRLRDSIVARNAGRGLMSDRIILRGSTVRANQGGGILGGWIDQHDWIVVQSSTISRNRADGDGGGIHCMGGCVLVDSSLSGNTASGRGGGLYVDESTDGPFPEPILRARGSHIDRNAADGGGGGIFNASTVAVQIEEGTLRDNSPDDCVGC